MREHKFVLAPKPSYFPKPVTALYLNGKNEENSIVRVFSKVTYQELIQ